MRNRISKVLVLFNIVLTISWVSIAYITISSRIADLKHDKHLEIVNKMQNEIKLLIKEKEEAILTISLAMSHNSDIKEALLGHINHLNLEQYSLHLKQFTSLKNVWFQVIDAKGKSFYRSWTSKTGDDMTQVRLDIAKMIQKPKIISSISTGKFDLTFKSMVPIYENEKFIGILETLGKFNSIAIKMQQQKYDIVVLVDKKYKEQLKFAFSKKFLDDYYVANINAKEDLLDIIHMKSVAFFKNLKDYYVDADDNKLVSVYKLPDIYNHKMATFILFYDLNNIDYSNVIKMRDRLAMLFFITYFVAMILIYYIYLKQTQKFTQKLNKELEEKVEVRTQELQEKTENLHHIAHHDSLTGLPNRLLFLDRLEQSILHAKRKNINVSILFLDLDRFKEINDTFGHEIGDKLLIAVTERLLRCVRSEDTVARLGGDEFTIILENLPQNIIINITKKIIETMKEPITIDQSELYTTFSIGISTFPEDGDTSNILLRNADTAMYKAKDNGKNNFEFYSAKMTELAFERVLLESYLRKAIEENEFIAYYQPKVNSQSGKIIGVEALIRWQNPQLGLISPMQFIPLAEDIGLIGQVDRWMMKEAMKTIEAFYKTGLFDGTLSLNVSMKQLEDKTFVQYLLDTIQEVGFDSQKLEMEITESQIMKNPESAIKTLNKIREIGVKISVDDFGTGHSSLSYLKKLPIDILKIDRSFVKDAYIDEDDAAIVKMIIALAKSLKLKFIAEGVETQEQLDFLKSVECHNIQGYFYSKPLPQDELKRFFLIHSED